MITIPQNFVDALETAIEKNETVLSRVTIQQIKEIDSSFETYQLKFYLKEYRKQNKTVSKAKQFEILKEENTKLKLMIQQVNALLDSGADVEIVKSTLAAA